MGIKRRTLHLFFTLLGHLVLVGEGSPKRRDHKWLRQFFNFNALTKWKIPNRFLDIVTTHLAHKSYAKLILSPFCVFYNGIWALREYGGFLKGKLLKPFFTPNNSTIKTLQPFCLEVMIAQNEKLCD